MDVTMLERCIGSREDSPELAAILRELGVEGKLRGSSDGDAIVKRPDLGLTLGFDPVDAKSSVFKLVQVDLYSDAEEGFKTFAGALPGGLDWGDAPEAARKKLGEPTSKRERYRIDIWVRGAHQINVQYRRSLDGIANIALSEPV